MRFKVILPLLFLAGIFCQDTPPNIVEPPVVEIAQGTVIGTLAEDGDYFEFHGIPYADSTSGSHRFKAPSPPPNFEGPMIAMRRGVKCVRALGVGYEGTEDCLVVDVFTPNLDNTAQLPVMVWVKGKEFDNVNNQELSFRNFVEKDVVVVSLNFRESVLGFLCLGTEVAPGNAGLKDIIAGLSWVKENIAQFGGNPDDVTLFGHGSGAAAVDLVTISPLATGLVHKAIAQSGNAFAPWAVTRDNLYYAVQVAEALGHNVNNVEELSEIFTRTSVAALMAVINELDLTDNSLAFAPCVERETLEGEAFLIKSPYQAILDGEFLQIPFITGFVENEGTIRAPEAVDHEWLQRMESSFVDFIQPDLKFENQEAELAMAEEIKTFYFRDQPITSQNIEDYLKYHGDTMILVSAIREVRIRAVSSSAPVYLYQFSYSGSLGEPFIGPIPVDAAAHSEELAYMFYENSDETVPLLDLTVSDILVERWTNFAKTGVPESDTSPVTWRPFTAESSHYLRILDDTEVQDNQDSTLELDLQNPYPDTLLFWDEIYDEHFLDAEGRWELTERNEDDEETGDDGSGDPPPDNDGGDNGNGGDEENGGDEDNGNGEADNEDDETDDEDATDSASTTMGYTFSILIGFALINKFHLSQMMS